MISLLFGSIVLLTIIVFSFSIGAYFMAKIIKDSVAKTPEDMTAHEWLKQLTKKK